MLLPNYANPDRSFTPEAKSQSMEIPHDDLTGVRCADRLQAYLSQPKPCVVLVLDIDRFQVFNACHGHGEGDRALTLSFGIAFVPEHGQDWPRIREKLDDAFYEQGKRHSIVLLPRSNQATP